VSKYYIDFDFGAVASYLDYVNKDVYDGWTDDQRAAFHAASEKGVEVGNQVLAQLVAQSTGLFTTKLERLTIEDGDKIREMFPASQMLDDYVVQMAGIGASQKEVAEEVRAFLREKLGQ
jgi:TRAP-type C4-dicarboxylate transport system substrate-binding protein